MHVNQQKRYRPHSCLAITLTKAKILARIASLILNSTDAKSIRNLTCDDVHLRRKCLSAKGFR
jgi:hypothetical protein